MRGKITFSALRRHPSKFQVLILILKSSRRACRLHEHFVATHSSGARHKCLGKPSGSDEPAKKLSFNRCQLGLGSRVMKSSTLSVVFIFIKTYLLHDTALQDRKAHFPGTRCCSNTLSESRPRPSRDGYCPIMYTGRLLIEATPELVGFSASMV